MHESIKTSPAWAKAIRACADQARARHFLDLLMGTAAREALSKISAEDARVITCVLGGSQALGVGLLAHPDWLTFLNVRALQFPGRKPGLRQEAERVLEPALTARDYAQALSWLRQFKQRELFRVGARDLARLSNVPEITQELSDVADVCLEGVWQVCYEQMAARFGRPYHMDVSGRWHPTSGCVLGLGKLGGQELNYSSDVDVIFLYSEEGEVFREPPPAPPKPAGAKSGRAGKAARNRADPMESSPRPVLANHQFFNRLAEAFIAEVTRMAEGGMLYRIDLRLRPEGDMGPLSRSLAGYENYYAQWGQTWERMMLIKTRGVAGDETLAAEFLEMIQPFRFPRSLPEGVLREVGAMKDRIENEVLKADEVERNVKLGRGGIREVEFIAQSLQLLHGGRQPFLQTPQTLPCLEKLVQYELLPHAAANSLREAYAFLRDVEHRLQMEHNRQTHTIPTESAAHKRLARLMGFNSAVAFESVHRRHVTEVRRWFEEVLKGEVGASSTSSAFPTQFEGSDETWSKVIAAHGFRDTEKALRVLREFVEGPGYVHVSPRTRELAHQLLPRLFALCPGGKSRSESSSLGRGFGARARARERGGGPLTERKREEEESRGRERGGGRGRGERAPLSDPDRVVTRLDNFISVYGARGTLFELWASNPAIFELLVLLFDRSEFLAELAIRTPDLVDELVMSGRLRQRKSAEETLCDLRHGIDDADQHLWLRRYHQAELMRIGLRDILGLADEEQYLTELSRLADACLQYAVDVVLRKNRFKTAPFTVIGLGKLGGAEIDYGSDLDLLFVTDNKTTNLPRLSALAREVMELLSLRTEQGLVFHTDARLRPDGEKGLLVNTLAAYESYYRRRAQLWELQTLTRARAVAGNTELGRQFQELAAVLTNFKHPTKPLAAFQPDWKQEIDRMRRRIEKERTPAGKADLAIKTGAGGLMDAEFVAQVLCLEHGWQEANTMRALERARKANALPQAEKLIDNYRRLRRVEGILRRWSYEGETVLPDDPAPYYRVSVRCGFESPEAFRLALMDWRRAIRNVYKRIFPIED
jgi:glutamate-ammonia-ligase adenylyltransferase